MTILGAGRSAPAFSREDQFGIRRQLADWRGKRWVLLVAYPADWTPV